MSRKDPSPDQPMLFEWPPKTAFKIGGYLEWAPKWDDLTVTIDEATEALRTFAAVYQSNLNRSNWVTYHTTPSYHTYIGGNTVA